MIENLLEVPPKPEMGDYAFPCFGLAKEQKKSPLAIAQDLAECLKQKGLGCSVHWLFFQRSFCCCGR